MQTIVKNYSLPRKMNFDADLSSIREFRRRARQQNINGKSILDDFAETGVKIIRLKKKEHRLGKLSDSDKKFLENQQERCSAIVKQINDTLQGSQYNASDVLTNGYPELLKNETRKQWLGVVGKVEGKTELKPAAENDLAKGQDATAMLNKLEPIAEKNTAKAEQFLEQNGVDLKQAEYNTRSEFQKAIDIIKKDVKEIWNSVSAGDIFSLAKGLLLPLGIFKGMTDFAACMGTSVECAKAFTKTPLAENFFKHSVAYFEKHGPKGMLNIANRKLFGPLLSYPVKWFPRFFGKIFSFLSKAINASFIIQIAIFIGEGIMSAIWDACQASENSEAKRKETMQRLHMALSKLSTAGKAFKYLDFDVDVNKKFMTPRTYTALDDWYPLAYYYDQENNNDVQGVVVLTIDRPETNRKLGTANTGYDKNGHKVDYSDIRTLALYLEPESMTDSPIKMVEWKGVTTEMFLEFLRRVLATTSGQSLDLTDLEKDDNHYIRIDLSNLDVDHHTYLLTLDDEVMAQHEDKIFEGTSFFKLGYQTLKKTLSTIGTGLWDMWSFFLYKIKDAPAEDYKTDNFVTTGTLDPMVGILAWADPDADTKAVGGIFSTISDDFMKSWTPWANMVFGKNNSFTKSTKSRIKRHADEQTRVQMLDLFEDTLDNLSTIKDSDKDSAFKEFKAIAKNKGKPILDASPMLQKCLEDSKQANPNEKSIFETLKSIKDYLPAEDMKDDET